MLQPPRHPTLRARCELTALPAYLGGALGRLRSNRDGTPGLADDLAGVATLTTVLSSSSLHRSLEEALDFVLEATGAQAAEVFLAEPGDRSMALTCHRGRFRHDFAEIPRFGHGEGFPGLVLAGREPVLTDNLGDDPRYLRTRVKRRGFHSYVCVPLLAFDRVVGAIGGAFRTSSGDLGRAVQLLSWVGSPLGLLVEASVARLREGMDAHLHDLDGDAERHFSMVLHTALKEAVELSGAQKGELYVLGEPLTGATERVTEGATLLPQCRALLEESGASCPALTDGKGVLLHGPRASWPVPCRRARGFGSTLYCIPLTAGEETIGLMRLALQRLRNAPPTRDLALAEAIAVPAALGVRRARDMLERSRRMDAVRHAWLRQGSPDPGEGQGVASGVHAATSPGATDNANAPYLDVRCFGPFELFRAGTAVTPSMVHRKKALTLLKILVTNDGRPLPKDTLIELLWPDTDPNARTSQFYVLVHELRMLVEPAMEKGRWSVIHSEGNRYYFAPQPSSIVDVREFRELVDLGRRAEREGNVEAAIGAYERAVELYRGDLLEDEPFADWCWQEREQLREMCQGTARSLAALLGKSGRWDRSVLYLRRALLLDPIREEVQRDLMYALWAAGRRDEAVRQYDLCADLLRRELGLSPLPETDRLMEMIRASPDPPS